MVARLLSAQQITPAASGFSRHRGTAVLFRNVGCVLTRFAFGGLCGEGLTLDRWLANRKPAARYSP